VREVERFTEYGDSGYDWSCAIVQNLAQILSYTPGVNAGAK
jgi:hypothetical protein